MGSYHSQVSSQRGAGMNNHVIFDIIDQNPGMTDVDRLVNLYWALSGVLVAKVPGEVVEIGCNKGGTSVFLRMVMNHFDPHRELHVYDSFQGLPEPGPADQRAGGYSLSAGLCAASPDDVRASFAQRDLAPPVIHTGWFANSLPTELPDHLAFAYLDGDFYDSIMTSLQHVYPRMAPGAIAVIDDYCDSSLNPRAWPGLPGPKRACDEFFADKPESMSLLVGTAHLAFGYFRKALPAG